MPATNKVGTQLLMSPHVRDKARALAIVRQEAVAEVYRPVLESGLERLYAKTPVVFELEKALERMGVDYSKGLEAMLTQRIRFADLFDADGEPKSVFPGTIA
jgi:hypothetical protein